MRATELDRLVARAQRGDAAALEDLCARARPMLERHARRLLEGWSADVEDAVQDALILVYARIATYRWEGSFAGWLYAVATRSMLRSAGRTPADARLAVEAAERALVTEHDPMTEAEWSLVEQDLHLACTIGVLEGLCARHVGCTCSARRLRFPTAWEQRSPRCRPRRTASAFSERAAPWPTRSASTRAATTIQSCSPRRRASSTTSCASASCTARTREAPPRQERSARSSAWHRPSPHDAAGTAAATPSRRACSLPTAASSWSFLHLGAQSELVDGLRADLRKPYLAIDAHRRQARAQATEERAPLGDLLTRVDELGVQARSEKGGPDFEKAVGEFRNMLRLRVAALAPEQPLPPDLKIVMQALILWGADSGGQWGEGVWDSDELVMSASEYARVPASQ
jgi:hypothetical protein